jgi:ADP-ribosylglycohydrolase
LRLSDSAAFVLESVPAALGVFLRSPEDPDEVIVAAVTSDALVAVDAQAHVVVVGRLVDTSAS